MIGNPRRQRYNLMLMEFIPVLRGWSKHFGFWNRATIDTAIYLDSSTGKGSEPEDLKISTTASGGSSPSTSDTSSANTGSDEIDCKPDSTAMTQSRLGRLSPWKKFLLFVLCVDTQTLMQTGNH